MEPFPHYVVIHCYVDRCHGILQYVGECKYHHVNSTMFTFKECNCYE